MQFYVDGVADRRRGHRRRRTRSRGTPAPPTNGAHTLTARARDAAGNSTLSAGVTVNVANTNFFQNEVLATGFNLPTAMKFLPDGRMLVVRAGRQDPGPAAAVHARPTRRRSCRSPTSARPACSRASTTSRFDPNFATNHFYYVFYTLGTPNRDRLSRFTANAADTGTVAGSELVLYQDPQTPTPSTTAARSCSATTASSTSRPASTSTPRTPRTSPTRAARSTGSTWTAPSRPTTRSTTAPARTGTRSGRYGLRNPYRALLRRPDRPAVHRRRRRQRLLDGRRRRSTSAPRGANYGWPNFEGTCPAPCTSPIYSWPHNGRDSAVTGGFVYHGTQFPASYQGSYFFADYTQNWIRRLTFDANGNVTGVFNFEPVDGSVDGPYGDIVYLAEGPDGALYYLDLGYSDISGTFGVSKIRRIRYVQSNQAPVAAVGGQPDLRPGAADGDVLERRVRPIPRASR